MIFLVESKVRRNPGISNLDYILSMSNPSQLDKSSNPTNSLGNSWVFGKSVKKLSVCSRSSISCGGNSGNLGTVLLARPKEMGVGGARVGLGRLTGVKPLSNKLSIQVLLSSSRCKASLNSSFPRENIRNCHLNRSHNFFSTSRSEDVKETVCNNVINAPSRTRLFPDASVRLSI
jgi:hypothetical protein